MCSTEKCEDGDVCANWAALGLCQIKAEYMLENCKKSCNVCSGAGKSSPIYLSQ